MKLKLPRNLLASVGLFLVLATLSARGDDGQRVFPQILLGLANTWSQPQTFASVNFGSSAGTAGTPNKIGLYGPLLFGLGISSSSFDYVAPASSFHSFYVNGAIVDQIGPNGFYVSKFSAAPTTAPGAGKTVIYALAGTTGGTCKVQIMAGTSTTPATLLDNIGSGC